MGRLFDVDELRKTAPMWLDGTVLVMPVSALDDAPTVDAVEVVRCKNCEYHISDVGIFCLCSYFGKYMRFEDFCSYGERRSDETDRCGCIEGNEDSGV